MSFATGDSGHYAYMYIHATKALHLKPNRMCVPIYTYGAATHRYVLFVWNTVCWMEV